MDYRFEEEIKKKEISEERILVTTRVDAISFVLSQRSEDTKKQQTMDVFLPLL